MSNGEIAHQVFPPCCPDLQPSDNCDVLDFQYRQLYPVTVGDQRRPVTVEVILNVRLERCSGPLTLGDLVYSTTLFPGEKVRLFTSDRRNRFTFDSATKVSYRHEQTQEEHFYMASWSDFMSDLTVRDSSRSSNTNKGHFDTHGETSGVFESIFGGPSIRDEALRAVDQDLVNGGLLDAVGGNVSKEKVRQVSFESKFSLPTPGVLVRGCLDDCNICEPALDQEIELDLERKRLENERLKREIELMDKDQQHRCCPEGEEEAED